MGFVPQAFTRQPGQGKPHTQKIRALLRHFIKFWLERKCQWKFNIRKTTTTTKSGSEAAVGSNEAGADVQPCGVFWYLCPH